MAKTKMYKKCKCTQHIINKYTVLLFPHFMKQHNHFLNFFHMIRNIAQVPN